MSESSSIPLLYHTHHSLEADDLPFWLSWARRQGGLALELGCGTGRVLLPLVEAGHTLFGLDRDAAMLDFLRKRLPNSVRQRVVLIRADLRNYCLSSRFALMFVPCNTYSTLSLSDRRMALNRARLHLAPKGIFIISIPNPGFLPELPEEGQSEVETTFSHPQTGHPVQVSSGWENLGQGVQFHWHYDHLLPDGRVERETISSLHYFQEVEGILRDFEEAGFEIIHTYGGFDSLPYEPESPSLIIVAEG